MRSSSPPMWRSIEAQFDHSEIEKKVEDRGGFYQGLDPRALYTSCEDLKRIFSSKHVNGTWVDLGAGTGQSALLYASLFPEREAIAVEASHARISAGVRAQEELGIKNAHLLEGDLAHCDLPDGQTYFLYFPTGPVLDRVLDELRKKKSTKVIVAIESHGDLLPRLYKENWLKVIETIPLSSPRHHMEAVVFKTCEAPESTGPHQLSHKEKYLLIEEGQWLWVGESKGLEWVKEERYQLAVPPRTIDWGNVREVKELTEFPAEVQLALGLRPLGELQIETTTRIYQGELRKISLRPGFQVEISTGEWVEWKDIKCIRSGEKICYESSSH